MTMHLTNTTPAQDRIYESLGDAQSLLEELDARLTQALEQVEEQGKQLEAITDERDDFKQRAEEAEALLENYATIIEHYNALVQ